MTSHSFQILTDQEVIDMKRSRGIMACAECQRRKLKCNKQFPCSSCIRRGRQDICPTGDMGFIGRGRRIMRSESLELSTVIHNMGDRIRQLETAVAEAHAEESQSPHPLLREELLVIKRTSELPRSSSDPTPAQLTNNPGALAVSASGTPRYFGPSAGPQALLSVQGSSGGDRAEYASPFAHAIHSFPLDGIHLSSSWDTSLCYETLLAQLPDELRAWALYDIFVADASWYGTPVMADELHELLTSLYHQNLNLIPATLEQLSPHALAVVFFAFAHATFADLELPAYSSQADTYFDLGRTALTLQSVFASADLRTIQALALAGLYHVTGGPRYSIESSWTMTSMAVGLCQTLRLHRECEHTRLDNKTAQRRRALFWEIYSLETYQSLAFARPLTIPLADISCEFPADTDERMDNEGRTIPGFFRTKWRFTKEVTAPIAQVYTSAKAPTYEEVLDLDQRLRQFIERAPFRHYYNNKTGMNTFLAYVRANIIPRFAANMMVYIHRGSFVQALKDRPLNPLESSYAPSFLAAYRGASMIIKSDKRSFFLFPDHFHRWWPIWKSLVNASFIVGSIVVKSPTSVVVPVAFSELLAAVELIEHGATHSFLAAGSLPVLQRLRNKAKFAYMANFHPPPPDAPPLFSGASSFELADDNDFEVLAGSQTVLERDSEPALRPSQPTDALSFIPGAIPPPPTPEAWQTELPGADAWATFPFGLPLTTTPMTTASSAEGSAVDAYLDYAQLQMQSSMSGLFPVEYYRGSSPMSEKEWASFLSILEQ
ncbi:Zn(2)-C6 fungal-type domain-containing protein [Mycena venus]|uniref:Zn(2)-C6 fungal-type domain-containing protein n=1 Tax=Mycena venus TaxID=2733690 RepID=A0A8H6XZZ4_9AGAR|nr:Zn(2)-C6 fungal-type domain-containing protein [Mycena venus]